MTVIDNEYRRVYSAAMILRRALKGFDDYEKRVALDSFRREVEMAADENRQEVLRKMAAEIEASRNSAEPFIAPASFPWRSGVEQPEEPPEYPEILRGTQDVPLSVVTVGEPPIPDDDEEPDDVAGDTDAEIMARAGVQHVHLPDAG